MPCHFSNISGQISSTILLFFLLKSECQGQFKIFGSLMFEGDSADTARAPIGARGIFSQLQHNGAMGSISIVINDHQQGF